MTEGKIYRPRKPMPTGPLHQLSRFAEENGLRFGQALSIALGRDDAFFYIENEEIEVKINEFIGRGVA